MTLRADQIAGAIFVVFAIAVFALSGDLPVGSLSSPGAGMMPKLVLGLMMAFGAILVARSGESPPLADIKWSDFRHAATVVAVTASAIALYTQIGFVLSVTLLLFVLFYFIERKNVWRALAVSAGVTGLSYVLFNTLLKSPLPPMPFWY